MSEQTVTAEQLANYLKKTGKVGAKTMHVLGKYTPFIQAMATTIGQEIMADALRRHDMLLDRVASLEVTDGEKGEYKALREIIMKWSEKIANYEANLVNYKTNIDKVNNG